MPLQSAGTHSSDSMSRFSHLLQPIRDLTKNWDIDVAAQLEEYLGEIERIHISFDGGNTTMNFAEAALVIQASACIYSKKVEYLYTLVYQTLDLIASKKRLQQASSVDNQGKDKDASFKDQEEEFLPLDDIKEAKNIDLKEDDNCSYESSQIVPRTPMALIKLGEKDKEDMLLSRTGEVLGSRQDFKMNTCTVHSSGALLLDLTHLSLLDNSFERLPTSTPQVVGSLDAQSVPTLGADSQPQSPDHDLNQLPLVPDGGMNDFDDDDEPGLMMPNDSNVSAKGCDDQGSPPQDLDSEQVEEEGRMALRNRAPHQQPLTRLHQPVKDPWKTLDPHEPSPETQLKLFKKGRSFKIPSCLAKATEKRKKKRKRNENENEDEVARSGTELKPLVEFISQAFYSHASKFPKNPSNAPKFQEFEYLYWMEFRKRQAFLKRERKRLTKLLTNEQFEDLNLIPGDKQEDDNPVEENDGPPYDDDNDDDDVGFGGGDDNFPIEEGDDAAHIEPMVLEDPINELIVSSYEDLVRRYVQGFLSNAQQYAQETDLSRRVRDWEEKIGPKLQTEETHRPFDIHKYGEEVLGCFTEAPRIPFKEIVKEKEPFEICRYFLATLQLANNCNVEIGSDGMGQKAVDTMTLNLLHKTPAHRAIATYRAPSVLT